MTLEEYIEEYYRKQREEIHLFALEILKMFDTSGMDEPN